ncbi:MAG: efflux RND transporter periplasmic adaptor subunit [Pararhodobacter sp.]|nr:efflux RND transporter periplasmic adaptor subunit [Pararhodobacter sp.]
MRLIGRIIGQAVGLVVVLTIGIVAWAIWLPSSHPLLDRVGLLSPLQRAGVPLAAAPEAAGGGRGGPPGGFARGPAAVIVEPADSAALQDRIAAIGTGAALRSVVVAPEAAGRVVEVVVSPGAYVEAGELLLRLDSAAEEIARDRAQITLEEAQETARRVERLRESGTASEVQLRDASLALRNAELGLRQAELDLSRRRVDAPISGWIGLLDVEVGAQLSTTSQLARIDDRSALLVDFRVPERMVGRLRPGDPLVLTPLARRDMAVEGHVRVIDSRVDETARNLRIQAEIPNEDDFLRAGMAFAIEMNFTGDTLPAVDPLAIQWSAEGSFVWAVRDGRAERVPVRIAQRSGNRVLLRGALEPGESIVLEGVQNLRPGAEVDPRTREQARPNGAGGDDAQARARPEPSET